MAIVRVRMIRPSLERIPQHPLPADYAIHWYRPGDRETWVQIHALAETHVPTSAAVYDQQFERNEAELARRQAFLQDAKGNAIGTATAWFDDNYHGARFGRVHWVAIIPEHQGKGLAKPLLTAVCKRLVELGHNRACLTTLTAKLPAIRLYLSFGFEPDIQTDEDRRAWGDALAKLDHLPRSPRPT